MPEIKDDYVLVKVHACGVCGTDIHIFDGDEGAAATPAGTVLGHEFSGEVVAFGKDVTGIRTGSRVCIDPNVLCGHCENCLSARGHFCENIIGIGTTVNGGFAEYCCVPQSQVYSFSEELSYEKAAMTEPVACCLHGIDMCGIKAGDTVAVLGGGMIGLIMVQLARLKGAATIILSEPVAEKRKLGAKLGADIFVDPSKEDIAQIAEKHGIMRISAVIECVGKPAVIEQAISIAGRKSVVMMFGLTKRSDIISVKPFEFFKKEIILKSSFINPYTQRRALDLIKSGRLDVSSMIYKKITPEELPRILSDNAARAKGKYIVIFD